MLKHSVHRRHGHGDLVGPHSRKLPLAAPAGVACHCLFDFRSGNTAVDREVDGHILTPIRAGDIESVLCRRQPLVRGGVEQVDDDHGTSVGRHRRGRFAYDFDHCRQRHGAPPQERVMAGVFQRLLRSWQRAGGRVWRLHERRVELESGLSRADSADGGVCVDGLRLSGQEERRGACQALDPPSGFPGLGPPGLHLDDFPARPHVWRQHPFVEPSVDHHLASSLRRASLRLHFRRGESRQGAHNPCQVPDEPDGGGRVFDESVFDDDSLHLSLLPPRLSSHPWLLHHQRWRRINPLQPFLRPRLVVRRLRHPQNRQIQNAQPRHPPAHARRHPPDVDLHAVDPRMGPDHLCHPRRHRVRRHADRDPGRHHRRRPTQGPSCRHVAQLHLARPWRRARRCLGLGRVPERAQAGPVGEARGSSGRGRHHRPDSG